MTALRIARLRRRYGHHPRLVQQSQRLVMR